MVAQIPTMPATSTMDPAHTFPNLTVASPRVCNLTSGDGCCADSKKTARKRVEFMAMIMGDVKSSALTSG